MAREFFKNLPNTTTPLTAPRLNGLLDGDEPMGNIVVDSVRTKNMLNPNASISGAIANNSTSEATDGSTSAITSGWMLCKPNTSYTLSGGYNRIRWQSKAENNTITFIGENLTTITTNSTAKWIRVYFYYNSGGAINPASITNIQVEEGSSATSYTPHQNLSNNPYVLYDNVNGSISTIQLNDNVTNYNYIEILFEAEDIYNSTKLYSANGKYVYLSIDVVTNTNNYFKNSSWLISGNSISFQTANQYNISSSGVGNFVSSTNVVKIHRVIGYK